MRISQPNRSSATIIIDEHFCKGCNLCIQVCPQKLFSKGTKRSGGGYPMPEVLQERQCSGCLLCEMTCPDLALSILKEQK
jgi:2-oxoglutarate ferredoxin oxidoreductase subunit delta